MQDETYTGDKDTYFCTYMCIVH